MTFQLFDKGWDCYIDVDDDTYVAANKDRLRIAINVLALQSSPSSPGPSTSTSSGNVSIFREV